MFLSIFLAPIVWRNVGIYTYVTAHANSDSNCETRHNPALSGIFQKGLPQIGPGKNTLPEPAILAPRATHEGRRFHAIPFEQLPFAPC